MYVVSHDDVHLMREMGTEWKLCSMHDPGSQVKGIHRGSSHTQRQVYMAHKMYIMRLYTWVKQHM